MATAGGKLLQAGRSSVTQQCQRTEGMNWN